MDRAELTTQVRERLARCGFFVSGDYDIRGVSFDIIARRDNTLLVIKVLSNIDGFSSANADELRTLARMLKGAPVVIGAHSGAGELAEGIIYLRHGVPILTFETLLEYFEDGVPPFVFAAPGGLYAKIDPEVIKKARRERGLSLGALADIAGVSRKAIQMYELGTMSVTLPVVDRLERYLGEPLVSPLNPFKYSDRTEAVRPSEEPAEESGMRHFRQGVFDKLQKIGYNVIQTRRCPFDAVSESAVKCTVILTGVGQANRACREKARMMSNIVRITEKEGVLFIDRKRSRENLEGMPVIGRDELRNISDEDRIVQLIKERRK
jgi:putative transcriptional regulator